MNGGAIVPLHVAVELEGGDQPVVGQASCSAVSVLESHTLVVGALLAGIDRGGRVGADRGGQRMGTGLLATVRLLPTVSRVGTAALVLLAAASAALPVALVVASGRLVGAAPAVIGAGLDSSAGSALLRAVAVVAGLYLAEQVVGEATGILAGDMARRLDGHLRERAVAGSLRPTGIAHLEEPETAGAVSLVRNLAPGMLSPGSAVAGLAEAVPPRLSVLGSAGVVATFSLPLAGMLLVAWAVGSLVVLRYFFANAAAFTGQRTDLRRSVYFRDLALTPPAAKETRVFGLAGWIGERFGAVWEEAVAPSRRQRRQGWSRLVAVFAGFGIGITVGLAVVGLAGVGGDLSLERVVILVGAVRQTLNLHFRGSEPSVAYGAAALHPLLALERRTRLDPAAAGRSLCAADLPARVLRFESVDFAYPGASRPVFAGLDLEVPAGQRLAIVGANGAGKTTLVKLLAGLYPPDRGRITVDGVDLADLDPDAWRAQMAVLFQDYVRFEAAAAENVGFGAVRLGFDAAALDRAAQRAGADEVVAHLERGWETILSRAVGGGHRPVGRSVAAGGAGSGAFRRGRRRPGARARRAHRQPGRAGRGRRLRPPARGHAPDGEWGSGDDHRDLAPLLHRAPGGPHRGLGGRAGGRGRHPRRAPRRRRPLRPDVLAPGRPVPAGGVTAGRSRPCVSCAAPWWPPSASPSRRTAPGHSSPSPACPSTGSFRLSSRCGSSCSSMG